MSFAPKRGAPTSPAHAPRRTLGTALPVTALAGSDSAPISDASDHASTAMEPYHYGGGIAPPRGAPAMSPATTPAESISRTSLASATPPRPAGGHALPAPLRHGIERLSGLAMEDVGVHYDSPEPARLGALAYARGAEIHLAPGQARHLPHEAWHVVQQKQGRVAATTQLKDATSLNDDSTLEREADTMGRRAAAHRIGIHGDSEIPLEQPVMRRFPAPAGPAVVQRYVDPLTIGTVIGTTALVGTAIYLVRRFLGRENARPEEREEAPRQAARFIGLHGWNELNRQALESAFDEAPGDQDVDRWRAVARALPANAVAATIAFCGLADRPRDDVVALATAFKKRKNILLDAGQWVRIAVLLAPRPAADVIAFCQLRWHHAATEQLVQNFLDDRNDLDAQDWAAVARLQSVDQVDEATEFCRLPRWTGAEIRALALAFKDDNVNDLTADQWLSVARCVADDDATSANALCTMADWDWAEIDALTQAYAAGHHDLSGADWASIAGPAPAAQRANLPDFLEALRVHDAQANAEDIEALALAARHRFDALTTMLGDVADVTVKGLTPLVDAFRKYHAGNYAGLAPLLQAIRVRHAAAAPADIADLLAEVRNTGNLAAITAFVNRVAARNTLAEQTALVKTIRLRNPGTPLAQVEALVQAFGGAADPCVPLMTLVDEVRGHGAMPAITNMLTAAVATLGAANVLDLVPLISRDRAQNTPPRVRQLLLALPALNARARFLRISGLIPLFLRQAPPNHPRVDYNAAGNVIGVGAGGPVVYHCDAWRYIYRRHTFRYFDFTAVDDQNSMWAGGTDIVTELRNSLPGAVLRGLVPNIDNRRFDAAPAVATNEVGVLGPNGTIAHLMPLNANAVENFSRAEADAIASLG